MPRRFKRLAHLTYECEYHVAFCPKYRYRILRDEVAEYTRSKSIGCSNRRPSSKCWS